MVAVLKPGSKPSLRSPLARLVMEGHRRKEVAVLGHGNGRHLQLRYPVEHLPDPAGAVKQRKLRMQMQMNELGHS